ncbi:hypothetical protein EI982_00740 (plasmid) [Haloplanus rallus]|uniref:DUF7964 domain-containing protein n=1 Tax=Haloplanus rallus TaxID=1816183 RepID=A0A6B9F4S7_9EURY|nr:hypothetical protein [Haloplanus rallus]QGX93401.1 hypothetical protein EI982_00740 [Haloplanus rallus]
MSEACRLCRNDRDLQQSHIIPRFVIKWLKQSGATPFLRGAEDPDTRIQDKKEQLLCSECEQRLGDWEQRFASHIFYPVIRQQTTEFEYDTWLQQFAMSLAWRVLVSSFTDFDAWSSEEQAALEAAEQDWRAILNGDQPLTTATRSHHIILMGETESVHGDVPEDWEFYAARGIDATVVTVNDGIHIYTKFPQMYFLSCVDPPTVDGLDRTHIARSGTIQTPQMVHSPWSNIPFRRAEAITENKASPREREKIKEHIQEHPNRLTDSKTIETFRRKFDRSGRGRHDPTPHLDDDECPVCTTNHRVVDALPPRPLTRTAVDSLTDAADIVFAKGLFISLDDTDDDTPDETGTIVLATPDATRVITLLDPGWVVDREIDHIDTVDPTDFGQAIWDLVRDEHATLMDNHAPGRDYTID